MGNGMQRFKGAVQQAQSQQEQMPGEALVAQGETMERIQTRYHTAVRVQVARSKKEVLRRVLEEAEILPEGLLYSWSVKNKNGTKATIEGPSIRLAMTLAREYGNCVVDADIVDSDETHWTFRGTFVDLETGFTTTRLFRQVKNAGKRGKFDAERLEDMQFQIGQSKAIRNAVVNAMPSGILVRAMEAARNAQVKKLTNGGVHNAIPKVVRAFKKYGVSLGDLEARQGRKSKDWTGDDLADLRAIFSSLEEGMTSADQEFEQSSSRGKVADAVKAKSRTKPRRANVEEPDLAPDPPVPDPEIDDIPEPPAPEPPVPDRDDGYVDDIPEDL